MIAAASERLGALRLTGDHLGGVNKMACANVGMARKTDATPAWAPALQYAEVNGQARTGLARECFAIGMRTPVAVAQDCQTDQFVVDHRDPAAFVQRGLWRCGFDAMNALQDLAQGFPCQFDAELETLDAQARRCDR